jgi:hypothetical protein
MEANDLAMMVTEIRETKSGGGFKVYSFRNYCFFILVLLVSLTFTVSAAAQASADATAQTSTDTSSSKGKKSSTTNDSGWTVTLGLYTWFAGMHGTVGALGHDTSVAVSGTDVLSNLQFSLMGAAEIRKNRWVMPIDYQWINLATTKALPLNDVGQTEARVKVNQSFVTPRFGYRVVDADAVKIDAFAGVRIYYLGQNITLRPSQLTFDQSATWPDLVGGGSFIFPLGQRAFFRIFGDAGAGGAKLDYQAVGWLGVKATRKLGIMAGWRYMDVDYRGSKSEFVYDTITNGPLVGLTYELGGKPAVPPSASCNVSPGQVMVGESVNGRISTQNFDPKHTVSYKWSSSAPKVSGTSDAVTIDTANLAPGTYSLTGVATDSKLKKNNIASCSASFVVNEPPKHPPVASCTALPTTVKVGEVSTITVNGNSPDGRPLTYAFATSAGQINGSGSTANLDTATATPGSTITATATVTDDRGLNTTCNATVAVLTPPVVVQEVSEVGSCKFMNPKKPWRVDNQCKAVLDDVALKLQREPNGKVYVVGYEEEEETVKVTQLGAQRAVNIKKYLTEGEGKAGIDQSRVVPVKGKAQKDKSAKIYFIPEGASFTAEETETIDESAVKAQ